MRREIRLRQPVVFDERPRSAMYGRPHHADSDDEESGCDKKRRRGDAVPCHAMSHESLPQ